MKTHKQYINVFTDLLCENGLTDICCTSQNKKHLYGTPAQYILMATMLVTVKTLCNWNHLNDCFVPYLDNKIWITSILNFQLQIVFTRDKMIISVVIIAFSARFLFYFLALQWCTSFPPILFSPSLWQYSHAWFWNVKIITGLKLQPVLPKPSASTSSYLLPYAQLSYNAKLF